MKGFTKCGNGHYYNEELKSCPYCSGENVAAKKNAVSENAPTQIATQKPPDDGTTKIKIFKTIASFIWQRTVLYRKRKENTKKYCEFVKAVEKGDITVKEGKFPWEDVFSCKVMKSPIDEYEPHKCPYCGEELIWIHFTSPGWTWEHLCGREGHLSICTKCARQVEFICTVMN